MWCGILVGKSAFDKRVSDEKIEFFCPSTGKGRKLSAAGISSSSGSGAPRGPR